MQAAIKKFLEFFDMDGFVRHQFAPPGQSETGHFYVQVLQRFRDAVRRKRLGKWQAGTAVSASR
jgi:hypothetical protein